ncbi:MAG: hypothetical protein ALECFALPRED_001248 [Alectoria fallacina]|uniref:Uncharacterized protein n=1 Tax=Alectoria fallacina TaxID=1903189 RepID=A0A8H3FCS2_9LECA|nr:MAG: hypothetical protein ALECFALPRED_001248 [Alectoria fallacina]
MVMTGQYSIVNCAGNTSLVVNLFNKLYSALLPVIQDAGSPAPSPAYTAFFKDPSYAPFISALFQNITTGVPLTPPAPYSFNGAATILCVTAPEQFTYSIDGPRDAYTDCLANPTTTSYYPGFLPPKQYIVLCPSFFTSNIVSIPPPSNCLTVTTYINRFRGNGLSLSGYKMWILLVMITHYYLYASTGLVNITSTNDVNKCFRLGAEESSLNVNNYAYYAASIYGNCKDFPIPLANGRELLEIDVEDPSDNGPDVASPATVTFIATDLEIGVEDTTGTP